MMVSATFVYRENSCTREMSTNCGETLPSNVGSGNISDFRTSKEYFTSETLINHAKYIEASH